MILTVCLSPSIDVTVEVDALEVGKTNVAKRKRLRAGGKAINVALGVSRLGGEVITTGFMYKENGAMFEDLLKRGGVKNEFILNEGRVRENYKFIDHRSMLTEVNDVGAEVAPEKLEQLLERVRTLSANSEVTVISGGLPRGVDASYYGELFRAVSPNSLRIADATGGKLTAAV
ncbi:MAG: 1-phosphofructokinase, partial [Clostridia bacterium]|nr:1-phosphofructokinase [Clostridia bacterium]